LAASSPLPLWERLQNRGLSPIRAKPQILLVRGSVQLAPSLPAIAQLRQNMAADVIAVFQDLVVPEAQDAETLCAEEGVAVEVATVLGVLASVDFDDEFRLEADEIKDVATQWYLAAELCPGELAVSKCTPKDGLGRGRIGAHLACAGSGDGFWFVAHGRACWI